MPALPRPRLPRFVPFGAPRFSSREELAIVRTMRSGWVGAGSKTQQFEMAFKRYVGCQHAVAVSSCTAALHLALLVNGIRAYDEVITTPLTFVATANAILMTGASVRFADVDLATYNISPTQVRMAVTKKTRAILPVHFGGLPVDLDQLMVLGRTLGLKLIEDAAHAIGARYHGKKVGASGNLVCFSFYPNKNITTVEGGMVTLANPRITTGLRTLRMHGLDADAWKRYYRKSFRPSLATTMGFKYNFTDLQASLGLEQLRKIESWQRIRERHAAHYDRIFRDIPGVYRQYRPSNTIRDRHALHLYTLRLDQRVFPRGSRDRVVQTLLTKNIGASVHYYPLHLHPLFRKLGYRRGQFPVAEKIGEEIFSLPLTPHLSSMTVAAIGKLTRAVIQRTSR